MKIVKVAQTTLLSPLGAADTSVTLRDFVDSKGDTVALADFGDEGYVVIVVRQGDTIEMIKCSAILQNADGSATLTVASSGRDLDPTSPYAGAATGNDFPTGAEVIVTNDPLTMSRFASLAEDNEFTGANVFDQVPSTTADPVAANDLVRKSYAEALVLGTLTTINVIVPAKAGETVSSGQLLYFDETDNEWKKCDADTAATVNNTMLGISQGAGTDGNSITGGVLLQGVDTHQSGLVQGDVMYASNTAGGISTTPGTVEVTVGIAKTATELYFAPRFNQMITEDQQDALAGNNGTPSSSNRYVTETGLAAAIALDAQTFNANGTWTKPSGGTMALIEVWGGGGSGASTTGNHGGSGGGGGTYSWRLVALSSLGATEAVTVPAAAAAATNAAGNAGGNVSFGSWLTGYGGGGGVQCIDDVNDFPVSGGAGGSPMAAGGNGQQNASSTAGTPGAPIAGVGTATGSKGGTGYDGGGAGGGVVAATSAGAGGDSYRGGAGGGGAYTSGAGAGGTSTLGGNGGAGSNSGSATAGVAPGGGGGAARGSGFASGAGAAGRVKVTVF